VAVSPLARAQGPAQWLPGDGVRPRRPAPRYHCCILAFLLLLALAVGMCVVAFRLLGKQRRLYDEGQGPPDLRRADDAEAAPPFEARTLGQAAEDFYAAGARPKWMRGVRDASITRPSGAASSIPPNSSGSHEARRLSGGEPTDLVRDGGVESQDEPPDQRN
jgi:hypothetical protein